MKTLISTEPGRSTISVNHPFTSKEIDRLVALRTLIFYTSPSLIHNINIIVEDKDGITISWNKLPLQVDLDLIKNICDLIGKPNLEHYLDGDKISASTKAQHN